MSHVCECGCGAEVGRWLETDRRAGRIKGQPKRFIVGHPIRLSRPRRPKNPLKVHTRDYVKIVELAIGRPLPNKAVVHHVNGNRLDNTNRNLVVCQDTAYHRLLHRRQRAYEATGRVDWLKCQFCYQWDAPSNLRIASPRNIYHPPCRAEYKRTWKQERKVTSCQQQ